MKTIFAVVKWGFIGVFVFAGVLGLILSFAIDKSEPNPATQAIKAAEQAENVRKGFHCLSVWDGSHQEVKKYVEKQMREPDSFEHIETRVVPVNDKGQHTLTMKYRARNGFGGMAVGSALATFSNSDCTATVLSIE